MKLTSLLAALLLAASPALAVTGTPPVAGPALQDGNWLNGLASGQNMTYIYGLTATGSAQASALQLTPGYAMYEVDTTASSTGVALPACVAGTELSIYNNGANTLTVYPSIANNGLTAAQDTINNTTSVTLATHVIEWFSCAKNGVWAAK